MKNKSGKVFLPWVILLLLMSAAPLYSHPHMFIDTRVTFDFEGDEMRGFWIDWYFDVMFTGSIRLDYDYNRDGTFDSGEVRDIEQNAFRNLRNFNYFTTVIVDGKKKLIEEVTDFSARMEADRLVYRFFVPFRIPVDEKRKMLKLIIFDNTFFCDIMYCEQAPFSCEGDDSVIAEAMILANRDMTIEYDPMGGGAAAQTRYDGQVRDDGMASGTAFPYELHLSLRKK